MTYNYKYIPASIEATAKKGNAPKNQYIELFQKTLDEQFYNAADWWTVDEETEIGSGIYKETDVRLTHVINAETGLKLGDDWKTILFSDLNHTLSLGRRYVFNDSVWMIVNTEIVKNITATATLRRCNNTLRWIDENTGAFYTEPCSIEYVVKEPRDYATQGSPFMTPGGYLHIITQLNIRTGLINENQRFLFGNPLHWTCYKVVATGLGDFLNVKTYDNNSTRVLTIDLAANFVNDETDDIINGIADVHTNKYTIGLNKTAISGSPTNTYQLIPSITYNGDSVLRPVEWTSSNSKIASVSGSGLVTFNSIGNCTITASINKNPVQTTCQVTVTASPVINEEIVITPNKNYILEGSKRTYSVYLYENNVQSSGSFVISCSGSNVPASNYIFTQDDGNHFSITNNLRSVDSYIVVTCTTGSVISPKTMEIYLRGAWQYDNV